MIRGIQAAIVALFAVAWMALVLALNCVWIAFVVWVVVKVLRAMGVL